MYQLDIGGIYLGTLEAFNIQQSYRLFDTTSSALRMADGSTRVQCLQPAKLITQISGSGAIPPGLSQLIRGQEYLLKCIAPRTISAATTATISSELSKVTMRSDVPLEYSAWLGDRLIPWNGSATITGAQAYRVSYVPQFDAILTQIDEQADVYRARWSWSLTFEQS
jgi:hypothetical protein